jgi:hypothetical protein
MFKQTPACGQFFAAHQSGRDQIKALASDPIRGLNAERLAAIREEVSARHFAFDQN